MDNSPVQVTPEGVTYESLLMMTEELSELEFKSSRTPDDQLKPKVGVAASAFWNSGGGRFVVGMNNDGELDGGVSMKVGRTSRADWIEQQIHRVVPVGSYHIDCIEGGEATPGIESGNCVVAVTFAESHDVPHMAPDHMYYIRAGKTSSPAGHFIVESLRTMRARQRPILTAVLRPKPHRRLFAELAIFALTDTPALDIKISILDAANIPNFIWNNLTPFRDHLLVRHIGRDNPCCLDCGFTHGANALLTPFTVRLEYHDLNMKRYSEDIAIVPNVEYPPGWLGKTEVEMIVSAIDSVAANLKK